jgi:hypothetical protein
MIEFRQYQTAVEQIIGREGETAILFGCFFFHINLCGGSFAPRQFNRCALLIYVTKLMSAVLI